MGGVRRRHRRYLGHDRPLPPLSRPAHAPVRGRAGRRGVRAWLAGQRPRGPRLAHDHHRRHRPAAGRTRLPVPGRRRGGRGRGRPVGGRHLAAGGTAGAPLRRLVRHQLRRLPAAGRAHARARRARQHRHPALRPRRTLRRHPVRPRLAGRARHRSAPATGRHARHDRATDRRMTFPDLRSFLSRLERDGQLQRVPQPVDPDLESTSLCLRAQRACGPALLMEQPTGSDHALLGNLFGHRSRIEAALGGRPLASLRELGELLAAVKEPRWPSSLRDALSSWPELAQLAHAAPRRVADAAFNGNVLEGDEVDLARLPIQRCWPGDAGRLVTLGLVITRGPRKPRQNVAIYRMQVLDRNRVVMRWLPHRGGALDYADWCSTHPGQPFPVLVAIGPDPATLLAAVAPIPDPLSEYEFAGLPRGRRTRTWHSTATGLDAPAGAEMLFEGHIHPGDTAMEGPFGDHTGYYNAVDRFPVLTIDRMRLRHGAIYHGSYMGRAPHDEPSVLASALNDVFVPILRKVFPEVVDFHLPPEACSY